MLIVLFVSAILDNLTIRLEGNAPPSTSTYNFSGLNSFIEYVLVTVTVHVSVKPPSSVLTDTVVTPSFIAAIKPELEIVTILLSLLVHVTFSFVALLGVIVAVI